MDTNKKHITGARNIVNRLFGMQISRYGLVSIFNAVYGVSAHYLLLEIMQLPLYPVHIGVYVSGVFISYFFNVQYTFNKRPDIRDGLKYFASYIVGLVVSLALLFLFDKLLSYSNFVLVLLVIPIRFLITFLIIKKVVFVN